MSRKYLLTNILLVALAAAEGVSIVACDEGSTIDPGQGSSSSDGQATSSSNGGVTSSSSGVATSSSGGNTSSSSSGKTSSSASSSSSTGSTSSGTTASGCYNGIQDTGETGVDCGGSCPLACRAYTGGTPKDNGAGAGCGGGAFICPRFMLFSAEMKQAAADDEKANGWPAGSVNYGVATLNDVPLCSCWELVFVSKQDTAISGLTPPKPLIVQNFNTGGNNAAFDIFVGKGGWGANPDKCSTTGMYTAYPGGTAGGEPGGGIRAIDMSACNTSQTALSSAACVKAVTDACNTITGSNAYVTTTTRNSCIEGNLADSLYHANWNVKSRQIECPAALTTVTGCKPPAGSLPKVDPAATASTASGWNGAGIGTTTMEDCCKASAEWNGNAPNGGLMYSCDAQGNLIQ